MESFSVKTSLTESTALVAGDPKTNYFFASKWGDTKKNFFRLGTGMVWQHILVVYIELYRSVFPL